MTSVRPEVLVVADRSPYLSLASVRTAFQCGASVTLMAPQEQPLRVSRYVRRFIPIPENPQAAADVLVAHLNAGSNYSGVILAQEPVAQVVMARAPHPDWLDWLKPETACAMSSKTAFAEWAARRGIRMPESVVCRSLDEARRFVESFGRSLMKINGTAGGIGVREVASGKQLESAWRELHQPGCFLMQRYIAGPVGMAELILRRGHRLAWWTTQKTLTFSRLGPSCARRLCIPDGMDELTAAVADATGFHGLCGFDWILCQETGRPYLIEFHPRATSGLETGMLAGIDIVRALADLIADRAEETQHPLIRRNDRNFCYFPWHPAVAVSTGQWNELRHWLPGSGSISWRNVRWDDPLPLLLHGFQRIPARIGRLGRRFLSSLAGSAPRPALVQPDHR